MGLDKLFVPLCGRPVLARTLDAIRAARVADQVVVAVRPGHEATVQGWGHGVDVVTGADARHGSVARALTAVASKAEVVLVHDGARPLVSPGLFARVAACVKPGGGALAALPVGDSLHREAGGGVATAVDRTGLWAAQTPQGFDRRALDEAVAWGAGRTWTDEAALFAAWGGDVRLVEGDAANLKLTTPADLTLAEAIVGAGRESRVGFGWDVHRLAAGRRLVLGGVPLARRDGLGLDGHSDADVLAHAVADAVLGAAARGDIGVHFPPDDPNFAAADSIALLARAVAVVHGDGWRVVNVDATVVAEEPKIAPHAGRMRESLAAALGVAPQQVSVKATTSEGLRPDAISANAVALIERTI